MIPEKLTSIAFDADQNITAIKFLGETNGKFGREDLIAINTESRLLPLIEELYQEFADGYEVSYPDPVVTSIKIKWEESNPVKVDLGVKAKSTKFGAYPVALPSPSTVHITALNELIRRISDAAFKEYVSYDEAVPAYTKPVYEQRTLFQALPDLSVVEKETVAA